MEDAKIIDVRGWSYSNLIILAKEAIDQNPSKLKVIVKNNNTKENINLFAKTMGYTKTIEEKDKVETIIKFEKKKY